MFEEFKTRVLENGFQGRKEKDANSIHLFTIAHQSSWYLRSELSFGVQIKRQWHLQDHRRFQ